MKHTADNNTLETPEKSVAARREELLKKGFIGGAPKKKESKVIATETVPEKLAHPTLSRPMGPKARKLPSKKARFGQGQGTFFSQVEEAVPLQSEDKLVSRLKEAILEAQRKYHEHYLHGTYPREENGWFSLLRHRLFGQEKAESFSNIKASTLLQMIENLDNLFNDPNTRYQFHSFASYLLDEFNVLLKQESLSVKKPRAGEHYNASYWLEIRNELNGLLTEEAYMKSEYCG
ncbi:hypothetical protein [Legionella hackeliae]|uniref:Uncharacterized protein n=1 Tax=Legionella hackeliae TaxID=449 RepID=A0A0A8UQ26_LEGHA|nr:hypothetical protein [Legionella hackeliae]KTD12848.1 hypothetical protein Lhac_1719 [Legionella hackeliae]CEK09152.1 protein of unknown function [Legionella hackeliae]STX49062.1 Uncharacterised protein [Legionella hackeliae]